MKNVVSISPKKSINDRIQDVSIYLRRYALSLTKDLSTAEDLIQDTFLLVIKNKDRFIEGTNFKAWVTTIMRNLFINSYRKKKRYLKILGNHTQLMSSNTSLQNEAEQNIAMEELNNLIDQIEDKYRTPFDLYRKGFQYKEISEKLKLPLGTIKSQIFHARKKIIKLYNHKYSIPA